MSLLTIKDLSVSLSGKKILKNLSLQCEAGEITAILGANGCGKTTLLRAICALISYDGTILLENENFKNKGRKEIAQLISYIPQKCGINISTTVTDTVMMAFNPRMKLLEGYSAHHREKAAEALEKVGAQEYADRDFTTLSEGEKQLVILARALLENSKLILCDEPESSLDYKNRHKALKLLKQTAKTRNCGVIMSLHEPSLALEYCDRLIIISDGNCIAQLSPKTDPVELMEEKLSVIYGPVSLESIKGKLFILPKTEEPEND